MLGSRTSPARSSAEGVLPGATTVLSIEDTPVASPLRVLVVDDCVDTTTSMCWLLEAWGHEARVAHDAEAALAAASAYLPHVVLLDMALQGRWDGSDLAHQFRSLRRLQKVVLICVSGYATQDDRQRSVDAGFDYFLAKPADPEEVKQLLAAVARTLALPRDSETLPAHVIHGS